MTAADVILDLSRLLSRVRHHTPSGVDRVEMAYARGLADIYGDRLAFAAVHPFGSYGRLPRAAALRFLDELEERWAGGEQRQRRRERKGRRARDDRRSLAEVTPTLLRLMPVKARPTAGAVYVQSSPHHLTNLPLVRRILAQEQAPFVCLVHDLIPIEFPEYARPEGARQHRERIATLMASADTLVSNSQATADSLRPWLARERRRIGLRVAPLGTFEIPAASDIAPSPVPTFVFLGTIEARKNHLLLLNLWRDLAMTRPGNQVPRLVLVGRRGWENEQVCDMLERCPALSPHVTELNDCSDQRMFDLLRGATALVLPSFAEGFGMPVAEALAVGTPVICSDLAALREVGGQVPDYLDPLDGPAWREHVLDYAAAGTRHAAQMARMPDWIAPTWPDHMRIVQQAVEDLRGATTTSIAA